MDVWIYIHAYKHTCIHTYLPTQKQTHINTHTHHCNTHAISMQPPPPPLPTPPTTHQPHHTPDSSHSTRHHHLPASYILRKTLCPFRVHCLHYCHPSYDVLSCCPLPPRSWHSRKTVVRGSFGVRGGGRVVIL